MPADFLPTLDALRGLKSSGPHGFEGLVRDALEGVCGHRLHLVKSGPQKGKDIFGEEREGLPRIAVETKKVEARSHGERRYGATGQHNVSFPLKSDQS